jgi:hypothetical protein
MKNRLNMMLSWVALENEEWSDRVGLRLFRQLAFSGCRRKGDGHQTKQTATGVGADTVRYFRSANTLGQGVTPATSVELFVGQFRQTALTRRVVHIRVQAG